MVAFKTGDRSILLYNVLDHHQTRSYDQAVAILDELMELESSKSQRLGKDDADR
jgi:alpha-galactosidase/6-phospho-beta-glucosidase family protein